MFDFSDDDVAALYASGEFDPDFYVESYPDVPLTGLDPAAHFLWIGRKLGRRAIPQVVPTEYRFEIPTGNAPAKVIAFYLPQFHPISENNEWWGEGFTEWTNVRPAKPQFAGHNQPLVPHESIGYYNLSEVSAIQGQAELAKQFGVYGFCFYYYWFAGKRLLEKPLDLLLNNSQIDLPFCVCWANENWTRRWDGLDQDILVAQKHSPDDDIACIADIARYARDPRYIRIDGKPLVVVYRPQLLPDPLETTGRWRRWAREHGLGELYLAYVQSFESVDPKQLGFEAAIEFPPINGGPPNITASVPDLGPDFEGAVYDWTAFIERSEEPRTSSYPLFSGVNPGWDNTARKKNKAHILIGATPDLYQLWLDRVISQTITRHRNESERLVFVNAWNEWAEGAVLEPRADTGFGYLEATRNALRRNESRARLAVAVHAFYPEILPEILDRVRLHPPGTKLFVSCPPEHVVQVRDFLEKSGREFRIYPVRNHGRDVLPFLKMLPDIASQGFDFVAKVHTKRSHHRSDGDQWRSELYDAVLDLASINRAIAAFLDDPTLGMIGPADHFVPMTTYLGSNRDRLVFYGSKLGFTEGQILESGFFAGTMFCARVSVLRSVLDLDIGEEEFEAEEGQIDGTLAHVMERVFAVCVSASGSRHGGNHSPGDQLQMNLRYGFA